MGIKEYFDTANWGMPFHFWSGVFFVLGCIVGSFLNVVIHRLPLEQSLVSPPSHCPHCNYSIPWYLNMPLITWLYLGGKCANCKAPISVRYFLVELLTGVTFLMSWLAFGHESALLAVAQCLFLSGLIAGTFIDFEHYIIPDEITLGGIVVGFMLSFLVPQLHSTLNRTQGLVQSVEGIVAGGGIIYFVLRAGKFAFGRQKVAFPERSKVIFTETAIVLPDDQVLYEELFYRKSDTVKLEAATAELSDRCYRDVTVRLTPSKLSIGEEEMDPSQVPYLEVQTDRMTLPREVMGLGDVKLMAAIGAFLGWQSVIFTLMVSSILGSVVGVALIAMKKQTPSGRLAYVPYISMAAAIWVFGGHEWWINLWNPR